MVTRGKKGTNRLERSGRAAPQSWRAESNITGGELRVSTHSPTPLHWCCLLPRRIPTVAARIH